MLAETDNVNVRSSLYLFVTAGCAACSGADSRAEVGVDTGLAVDGGGSDGASTDAVSDGAVDASTADAGVADSGPDAAQPDTGPPCTSGFVDVWTDAAPMPAAFESHALVSVAERLYATGGWDQNSGARRNVYVRDNGIWRQTSPMPARLQHHGAVAFEGALYVFGGDDGFGATVSGAVYRAQVGANGDLGQWERIGSLDTPRSLHATVLVGDRVFLIGGINSFAAGPDTVATVVSVSLAGGTLGSFVDAGALPEGRAWLAAANSDRHVFVAGGILDFGTNALEGSVAVAEVQGSAISAFRPVAQFSPRMRSGLVVVHSKLLAAGGLGAAGILADVQSADIQADGSLSAWTARANLPEARYAFSMALDSEGVAVSGGFYQPAGFDTRAGVWSAPTCGP